MKTIAFSAATTVALACFTVHAQLPLSGPREKMQVHTPESMAKDAENAAEKSKGKSKPKFVNADPPAQQPAVPAFDPGAPNTAEGRFLPKWLLLRNGRMLFGEVLKDTTGYHYQHSGAKMKFSLTEVEAVTDSKSDIYRYKKNRIAPNDLEERLELARWCLLHSLVEEAKTETKSVLAAAPDHARAKKLLSSLTSDKAPMMTQHEQKHGQGGASLAGETAGFGNEAIDQFTDRVQLILLNKCGRCHCNSRHESDFKLSSRRITPSVTKINFRAAELMVDLNNPGKSKLLQMAITPHGGPKVAEAGFGGPNDPNFQTLKKWTYTLSKNWHEAFAEPEGMPQIAKDEIPLPARRPKTTPPPQKQVAKMKSPAEKPGFSGAAADDAPPQRPSLMNAPKKAAKAPPKQEVDPLDPNDFNRSEGGQPAPTSKPADPPPKTEKSSGDSTPAKDVFKDVYGDLPESWKKK